MFMDSGGTVETAEAMVASYIADANMIYVNQVNVRIVVSELFIQDTPTTDNWRGWNDCSKDIGAQLDDFTDWVNRAGVEEKGLWHLLTNCHPPPGVVGLAYVGVLCYTHYGYNSGITSKTWSYTWKTFAHEIG